MKFKHTHTHTTNKLLNPFTAFLVYIFTFIFLSSCEKENIINPENISKNNTSHISIRSSNQGELAEQTVLGQTYDYPFTVSRMTNLYNLKYGTNKTSLPTTHLYVKFTPQTIAEDRMVQELESIYLNDYPYEREVLEIGEHYHDMTSTNPQEYYAIVPANYDFNGLSHVLLENLYINFNEMNLMNMAKGEVMGIKMTMCGPDDLDWPECQCDMWIDQPLKYETCLETIFSGGGSGGGSGEENPTPSNSACGCEVPNNENRPAGCVSLEDALQGDDGVIDVIVQGRSIGSFGAVGFSTRTDENGCWKAPWSLVGYGGKSLIYRVKYKNDKVAVRAIRGIEINGNLIPQIGGYKNIWEDRNLVLSGPFNNLRIHYEDDPMSGFNRRHFDYQAAVANNSVIEFHEYADQLNIEGPPEFIPEADNLDILLTFAGGTGSAAPMWDDIGASLLGSTLQNHTYETVLATLFGWRLNGEVLNDSGVILAYVIASDFIETLLNLSDIWAPDIVINCGDWNNSNIDRVKSTYYHEIAHAAHYNALPTWTRKFIWRDNVEYIADLVAADLADDNAINSSVEPQPYGNGTTDGAELCAIIEAYADYLSDKINDMHYGLNTSNGTNPSDRWIYRLEDEDPGFVPEPDDSWIPYGLFPDLIDDNTQNPPLVNESPLVTDNIMGFSYADIENAVTNGSPRTIQEVNDNLQDNLPSGVTQNMMDQIFTDYGY